MNNTQPISATCRRGLARWLSAGLAALVLSVAPAVFAQETGTVNGQVVDSTTGKYLEGAEVGISGTALATTTQRDGTYTLRNVPAGPQTVVVNYPGLDTSDNAVTVAAGQTATIDVKLGTSEIVTLGEFRVEGTKEGMSQAVALQKVAVQSKLVAAGDQFGSISEGNIGEYLKYLPGVGVDYNSNDARGISLRGLKTQFTIVAIDGTPMASAASGGTNRRFETEQVASNNVETTEIYKTLTPDLPADATGGFVNMVTKSAFDRQDERRFNYDVSLIVPHTRLGDAYSKQSGTWGKNSQYVIRPNIDLNYAQRVNEKFGFNVSYRMSERYDDSPRTEYTWRTTASANSTGAPISLTDPTLQTYNQTNEQKLTHRESFAAKVDYRISDATKLTFAGQWNWYDLTFMQRATTFNLATTATGTSGAAIDNAPGIDVSNSANGRYIQNNIQQRNKYGTTIHGNTTFSHEFSDRSKVTVAGYWSQASSYYRDHTNGYVAQASALMTNPSQFTISNVATDLQHPAITGIYKAQILDLDYYTLSGGSNTRIRPQKALDTKSGIRGDYKYDFDTSIPVTLQVGGAFDKTGRGIISQEFRLTVPADTNAGLYQSDYTFDYDEGFGTGEVLDVYKIYNQYGTVLPYPQTWNVYRFDEDNSAVYTRVDVTPFKNLTITGGARYEKHTLDASGRNWGAGGTASRNVPYSANYDKIYPSLSARYTPTRSWVLRAGVSKTVGHPDYADVLPLVNIPDSGNANITVPDDDLKPYYVTNYDAIVEYYFSKSGLVSASLFRKDITGYITSVPQSPTNTPELRARFPELDENQTINSYSIRQNGADSTLQGVELLYNQTLSFLPKPFNGLNVQANWTKIDIDADDLATRYGMERDAVTQAFNFIVGYRFGKLSTSVSNNWTDDTLIGVGTSSTLLNSWKAPDWKTTVSVRYEISRHYIVYGEVSNLFSKREEYYKGTAAAGSDEAVSLPMRYMIYGYPHISLGLRGTF